MGSQWCESLRCLRDVTQPRVRTLCSLSCTDSIHTTTSLRHAVTSISMKTVRSLNLISQDLFDGGATLRLRHLSIIFSDCYRLRVSLRQVSCIRFVVLLTATNPSSSSRKDILMTVLSLRPSCLLIMLSLFRMSCLYDRLVLFL